MIKSCILERNGRAFCKVGLAMQEKAVFVGIMSLAGAAGGLYTDKNKHKQRML